MSRQNKLRVRVSCARARAIRVCVVHMNVDDSRL